MEYYRPKPYSVANYPPVRAFQYGTTVGLLYCPLKLPLRRPEASFIGRCTNSEGMIGAGQCGLVKVGKLANEPVCRRHVSATEGRLGCCGHLMGANRCYVLRTQGTNIRYMRLALSFVSAPDNSPLPVSLYARTVDIRQFSFIILINIMIQAFKVDSKAPENGGRHAVCGTK